jgi:hypothetical protein
VYFHELLHVVPWRGGPHIRLSSCTADELDLLESLRLHFAPYYLLSVKYRSKSM